MDDAVKWSVEAYTIHSKALRVADKELQDEKFKHITETVALNDRRYTEGNELRAMALKIKETADRDALELDRASQAYKAERYDVRSEQSLKEAGIYATRDDLAEVVNTFKKSLKPIEDFISNLQGATQGGQITMGKVAALIAATGTIIGILVSLAVFLR